MNEQEAAAYWEQNAEAWTALSRAGFDVYRDHLNTPAFLKMLPDITGLNGLDIGCGEGHNTRLLAQQGATLTGIDISPTFIKNAEGEGITYLVGSATDLPFETGHFDFATSFMCLMDLPGPLPAIKEAFRVIKPGGFLQFSITHPCYNTPHRKNLRYGNGQTYAIEVGEYFRRLEGRVEEWSFSDAPMHMKSKYPDFKVPLFNYTLSEWVNAIITAGFTLEAVNEPMPSDEVVKEYPALQDAQVVSYFLHFLCRKL